MWLVTALTLRVGALVVLTAACRPPAPTAPAAPAAVPTAPSIARGKPTSLPVECGPNVPDDRRPCPDDALLFRAAGQPLESRDCQFRLASDGVAYLPDLECTPGGLNRHMTRDVFCEVNWPTGTDFVTGLYRAVPDSVKQAVYGAYGVPTAARATATALRTPEPGGVVLAARGGSRYQIDHIVALQNGGTNHRGNLWPQPAEPVPGFREKHKVDAWLHDELCARSGGAYRLADEEAHMLIRQSVDDWTTLYRAIGPATLKSIPPRPELDDQDGN
jgi:hypothetical protein